MNRLRKFWSLPRREKEFLCEASILLFVSNASVKAIPFRHIDRLLRARWSDGIQGDIDHEQEIRLVKHSISRAANVLPGKSLCLSRSIAQFIMLRRRRIPAILFLGVRCSGHSSLEAHAWVDTGPGGNDKNFERSGYAIVKRIGTGAVDLGPGPREV
jgi:Transglutaminase-like superfamily